MKRLLINLVVCSLLPGFSWANTPPTPSATQPNVTTALPTPTPLPLPAQPTAPEKISCDSHFAKDQSIPTATLETWATQAAIRSFTFDPKDLDNQLSQLKTCYTDLGWKGFNDALSKSGNLDAIKNSQLVVSSTLPAKVAVVTVKENEWKASFPLNVTYANKDQKIIQALHVDLLIQRKPNGDLGVVQLIATPLKTPPTVTHGA